MLSLGSWLPSLPSMAWGTVLMDSILQGEGAQPALSPTWPLSGPSQDPLVSSLAGLVGACAVSVLCSLVKIYLYIQCLK